ncbi:MAG TPA: ribbon-helix-helix protein, CopG family [Sphingomicrobium sp.]|nr:ribbon-helix-helix protein, CopG family [Sphingomicrobium sp.]
MRTARTTVLMTPEEKAALEKRAARLGVSSGEYIRLAVDNYEKISPEEEAELAALVEEANVAIPRMAAMLDQMSRALRETHEDIDRSLRAAGIRK